MRRLAVALGLVLTAAACGSGGGGVTSAPATTPATTTADTSAADTNTPDTAGPDTTPTTTPATTPATKAKKDAVGQVSSIVPVGGTVDGARAFQGQDVAAQDVVSTEPNGKVIFALTKLLPFCQVETDSAVQVLPGNGALVDVQRGTALCRTSAGGQLKQFVAGGVVVTASDPVVLLGWDGDTATVQVAQGYVKVAGNGDSVIVGANQQAQSGPGGTGVGPWDPGDIPDGQTRDAAAQQMDQAVAAQGRVRYPGLTANQSPTLKTAQDRGALVIGVDDQGIDTFVQELFGEMGNLWKVTVSTQSGTDESLDRDIIITSSPPKGSNAVPIGEVDGTTYFALTRQPDKAMTQAIANFLSASLRAECPSQGGGGAAPGASCYEDVYHVQVGADLVPLGPLAGYLGLG